MVRLRKDDTTTSTKSRVAIWAALLVFAAALAVRLVYAAQMRQSPLFQVPSLDADTYYQLGRQFAQGHWLEPLGQPYWQPPFYPLVLGLWMKVMGTSVLGIKLGQLALGSVNCALIFLLANRIFSRRVGLAAGLAAALYGPLIYFDGELLTPALQIFLNICALLVLLNARERNAVLLFGAAGLLLGLSIITRPDVVLFTAGALVWIVISLRRRVSAARLAAACVVFALGAALPVAPVAVRNAVIGHDVVAVSSNGGINFYIGNNPDEERTRAIRPGPDWDRMLGMAEKHMPNPKPSEKSAYFFRASFRYIAAQPFDYARLLLKKTVMFITAVEGRRNLDIYYNRGSSSLYSVLLWRAGSFGFPFGIVLPLAVLGMALRPRREGTGLLYLYLAAQFVAVMAFFVTARYRLTAAPVLLVFASYAAFELWDRVVERRMRSAALPLAIAAAVLVVSNLNIYGVDTDRRRIDADTQSDLAIALESRGDRREAVRHYEESIRLNPDYEVSRVCLAALLADMGESDKAKEHLRAALRRDPRSPASNGLLADLLEAEGDLRGAAEHYSISAQADPRFVPKLVKLAENAYSQGEYPAAARALQTVVKLKPDWAEARRTYGVTLMKLRRLDEAIDQLQRACNLDPKSSDCFVALGLAYHQAGRTGESDRAFEQAVKIGPADEVRAEIDRALNKPRHRVVESPGDQRFPLTPTLSRGGERE